VDWKSPGAPVVDGRKAVGVIFPDESIPFKVVAPNITPDPETGIGKWTDQEIKRALREGIGRDGRVLVPIMPYMWYRSMSEEDLESVIAYLRSIPAVKNSPPKMPLPEPVQKSLQAPPPVTSAPQPDLSIPEKRGAYLAMIGTCSECHTPLDPDMRPRGDLEYAGGFVLKGPWGEVASANLTPDPSGIPYYTEAQFLEVIRTGHVKARKLNSIMPWGRYRNMNDQDLKAIFAYLKTLKPIAHRVDNTEPPTPCKRCGSRHGLGAQNQ
jgi:mono/diheme cytochrome c family protein